MNSVLTHVFYRARSKKKKEKLDTIPSRRCIISRRRNERLFHCTERGGKTKRIAQNRGKNEFREGWRKREIRAGAILAESKSHLFGRALLNTFDTYFYQTSFRSDISSGVVASYWHRVCLYSYRSWPRYIYIYIHVSRLNKASTDK